MIRALDVLRVVRNVGGFALLALFPVTPALSQSSREYTEFKERCRREGGTPSGGASNPVCIFGNNSGPDIGRVEPDVYIAPRDPVVDQLVKDTGTYDYYMNVIREHTRSVDLILALPQPASGTELSGRLDRVMSTLWPEFRSASLEADLLRRQSAFFDNQNSSLRQTATRQHGYIARVGTEIPALQQQISAAEARLPNARKRETDATALALAQLNDRTSERRAIATALAFAATPYATVAEMDSPIRYSSVPGAIPVPVYFLPSAPLAPREASAREPSSYATLSIIQPASGAPMAEKLDTLYRVANGLRQDVTALPYLRRDLPNKRAEYAALTSQIDALGEQVSGLDFQKRELDRKFRETNGQIDVFITNSLNAEAVTFKEILSDVVRDGAVDKMRAIGEEIAGAEGIDIPAPPTDSIKMIDYVRRGGRVLLPVEGYRAQWDAFNEVQQKAIAGVGNTESLASEAARVLALGSPGEAMEVLERVFATVNWQAFDYVKTTGFSALPEGEDKSAIIDWFERYADKRRERETGD